MRISIIFVLSFLFTISGLKSQSAFINEINYLASDPVEHGLEIAGEAGTDLEGWSLVFYTIDGAVSSIEELTGVIPDQQNGHGVIWYDIEQGSDEGGIALVTVNEDAVQFISYTILTTPNTVLEALEGPAEGMIATFAGTQLHPDQSIELTGTGIGYLDFIWGLPSGSTPGQINTNQYFGFPLLSASPSTTASDNRLISKADNAPGFEISAFPNPAVDQIMINWKSNSNENLVLRINDSSGKVIVKENVARNIQNKTLNISHLPSGQYFLSLTGNQTREIINFIKR